MRDIYYDSIVFLFLFLILSTALIVGSTMSQKKAGVAYSFKSVDKLIAICGGISCSTTVSTISTTSTSSTSSTSTSTSSTTSIPTTLPPICTCNGQNVPYCPYSASCSLSSTGTTNFANPLLSILQTTGTDLSSSPTKPVNDSNGNSAPWLLSCPKTPVPHSLDSFFFNATPFVGGDACLASNAALLTTETLTTNFAWDAYAPLLAYISSVDSALTTATDLNIQDLAYSPSVDNYISNNFSTFSYIFKPIPSSAQHGIWTWSAKFADFSKIPSASSAFSAQSVYYYTDDGTGNYCLYTYDYSENTKLDSVKNYFIPFEEVLPNNQYNLFKSNITPYFLYNYQIPVSSSASQSLSLSYDILSPFNYYNATADAVDPMPIDTPSKFFVSYKTYFTSANCKGTKDDPTLCSPDTSDPNAFSPRNGQPHYLPSAEIKDPVAVTYMQNDYLLVVSKSSGGHYLLNVLRLIPKGYNQTVAPGVSFSSTGKSYTASSSEWQSTWTNYWKNMVDSLNDSVYLMKSIDINAQTNLDTFTPINISADAKGDVFFTGNSTTYDASGNPIAQPAIAAFKHVLTSAMAVNYTTLGSDDNFILPEIAASPTGDLIFLANQSKGNIYIHNGSDANLGFDTSIPLTFGETDSNSNFVSLNITNYLLNGGLFSKPLAWANDPVYNPNDKAKSDIVQYHHPVALQDVNGYLYVLDDWSGSLGFSLSGCGLISSCVGTGTFFNMLDLRVLNSTLLNVPINPTQLNNVYSSTSCATTYPAGQTPNECFAALPPTSPTCSAGCTLSTAACIIQPLTDPAKHGNYFKCVPDTTNKADSSFTFSTATFSANYTHPPYGWILSANITQAQLVQLGGVGGVKGADIGPSFYSFGGGDGGNINQSISYCSSTNHCTYAPGTMGGFYNGGFLPWGPGITSFQEAMVKSTFGSYTNRAYMAGNNDTNFFIPFLHSTSLSVNFDNNLDILFSNFTYSGKTTLGYYSYNLNNSNFYKEILLSDFKIQNYTKLFEGNSTTTCLSNDSTASGIGIPTECEYVPEVKHMYPPLYVVTDPFKSLESAGGTQILSNEGQYASKFTGGKGAPTTDKACADQVSDPNGPGSSCHNTQNVSSEGSSVVSSSQGYSPTPLNNPSVQNYLSSSISGRVLVPYTYTYTTQESWNNWNLVKNHGACTSPGSTSSTSSHTYYSYAVTSGSSDSLKAYIDSGDTYLQLSPSKYYVPMLSDINYFLSPSFEHTLQTDRVFGNIYLNLSNGTTSSPTPPHIRKSQYVLNATHQLDYVINTFTLGGQLAYQTISSTPLASPLYGTGAFAKSLPASSACIQDKYITKQNYADSMPTSFSYILQSIPGFAVLFDWYNAVVYQSPLSFGLNSGTYQIPPSSLCNPQNTGTNPTLGFQRLVYVLNDRFNNTIYLPMDIDVVNNTVMSIDAKSTVDQNNPNSTVVAVSGTAGFYTNFHSTFNPLKNQYVYLYYDTNINFNYNPESTPGNLENAQLCAFGSSSNNAGLKKPSDCSLQDPVSAFKAKNQYADVVNYAPELNSSSLCPPPPQGLLKPNYRVCNIYGNDGSNPITPDCGQNPNNVNHLNDICVPIYANGTGRCTMQVGLIGKVLTDAQGGFSTTITACGTGQHQVIGVFYGTPGPEPVVATESALSLAAIPTPAAGSYMTFNVFNYQWSPNATFTTFPTGSFELSYGAISVVIILIIAFIATIFAFVKGAKTS